MNQINKLVNKIKDNQIESENQTSEDVNEDNSNEINHLTEDNLDDYLRNVDVDAHSKELLERYLNNKE